MLNESNHSKVLGDIYHRDSLETNFSSSEIDKFILKTLFFLYIPIKRIAFFRYMDTNLHYLDNSNRARTYYV
ncbi:hypothetical protein Bmyc01_30760 [Bacillus mycoides]|nr:hypothetical protein Bmyc01_30760 [Bacillus mycoides]